MFELRRIISPTKRTKFFAYLDSYLRNVGQNDCKNIYRAKTLPEDGSAPIRLAEPSTRRKGFTLYLRTLAPLRLCGRYSFFPIFSSSQNFKYLWLDLSKMIHTASDQTLAVAEEIVRKFKLKPRDAFHAASGVMGEAQYFLTCDDAVTRKFRRTPLSVVVENEVRYMEVMNPEVFVARMRW